MADDESIAPTPTGPASLDVVEVGLACCALEAASSAYGRRGSANDGAGRTVLVVAGTVTNAMAGTIKARYDAAPGPVTVVAFGACATTGGPYWDSYAVTPGIGRVVPVDVAVPGCPPRPEALAEALANLDAGEQRP